MPKIPITIPLEKDELLYSWMMRTAHANGFSHFRLFYNAYISPNITDSQKKRMVPKYELMNECNQIYDSLSMDGIWTLPEFFLQTGIYQFFAPFMMPEQQGDVLSASFTASFGNQASSISTTRMIPKLKYCPLCAKEDIQATGHIVYHRSHHLPGVTACWKHKMTLITYNGVSLHETEPVGIEENTICAPENEYTFATFAKDFFDNAFEYNYMHLKKLISKAIRNKQIDKNKLFEKYGHKLEGTKELFEPYQSEMYMNPKNTLIILKELYDSVLFIPVADSKKIQNTFLQILRKNKCLLSGAYNPLLCQICTCDGRTILVNPVSMDKSWKVPDSLTYSLPSILDFKITDNQSLEKAIQELTGNEYSLVGGNFSKMSTSVEIRHNTCGHVQRISPALFIEGRRCKHCVKILSNENLAEIVSERTSGEYNIIGKRTQNRFALENVNTGKRIVLQKSLILQELRRPTTSTLLPVKNKGVETTYNFDYERLLEYINNTFPEKDPVFTDELTGSGFSYSTSKRHMEILENKGFFKRISPGVYIRSGMEFTPEEIVYHRYINRHGKPIGYYTNKSALYHFGIIEKPDSFSVATSKETTNNIHGRTTKFLGYKLRIHGLQVKLDEDNWEQMMLLDMLSNFMKYLHSFDKNTALSILKDYVKEHNITYLSLSKYVPLFPRAAKFIRLLYMED